MTRKVLAVDDDDKVLEILSFVLERTRQIPVIVVTAAAEDIYKQISADLGVAEHITKPFHPVEPVEHIKTLLDHPSGAVNTSFKGNTSP